MEKPSPGVCLGALDAINFLLENYNEKLNDQAIKELEIAKDRFQKSYEDIKYVQEPIEIVLQNKAKMKKTVMLTYGKLYVSSEIENDTTFSRELQKNIELHQTIDPSSLEYNIGALFAYKKAMNQLENFKDKNYDKINNAIHNIKITMYAPLVEITSKAGLQNEEMNICANSYNGLLAHYDVFEFCNNHYAHLISDNYDFGVTETQEKMNNINFCKQNGK